MATRTGPWFWLSNPDNQKTLAFIGGGVTVGGNVSGSPIIAGGNVTIGGQPVDPEQAKKLIESQGKAVDAITSRMTDISNAIETGDASKLSNPPAPASKGP